VRYPFSFQRGRFSGSLLREMRTEGHKGSWSPAKSRVAALGKVRGKVRDERYEDLKNRKFNSEETMNWRWLIMATNNPASDSGVDPQFMSKNTLLERAEACLTSHLVNERNSPLKRAALSSLHLVTPSRQQPIVQYQDR
jgi:hypothetical protein